MQPTTRFTSLNWRWIAALSLFLMAFVPFLLGVSVSEQADELASSTLAKIYFALALFVFGGTDFGMPQGGPDLARGFLWVAYIGAPILTASALIEAILRVVSPEAWTLRRLRKHVVIVGAGEIADSYLRTLRKHSPDVPVVMLVQGIDPVEEEELVERYDVRVVHGAPTHRFVLRRLRLDRAARVVLLGDDDFESYEAAGMMLRLQPRLSSRIVLHCHNLRFMRVMAETAVGKQCLSFNAYHLAAAALVRDRLIEHFRRTSAADVVVLAGFGRFGQTVLEELHDVARGEVETVAIIDLDANRRILVAEEQARLDGGDYRRLVLQGDVSDPKVWHELGGEVSLASGEPTVVLGTGSAAENLRSALWIKQQYPEALVFSRTNDISDLALEVGAEHDIASFSIRQLIEDNLPFDWLS